MATDLKKLLNNIYNLIEFNKKISNLGSVVPLRKE
jgi:hypothetical protein